LLASLPERAGAAGKPGLYQGILGLLGASAVGVEELQSWIPDWRSSLKTASGQDNCPADLLSPRPAYYRRAVEEYLSRNAAHEALWPILRSWTQAVACLPEKGKHRRAWADALAQLGLTKTDLADRAKALDAFLDGLEEILEGWARKHGV
jgi:hypothetical protein